jgi:hypothetical protein
VTWAIIEEVPSRAGAFESKPVVDDFSGLTYARRSKKTEALTVWRCQGCRALACGPKGATPGECYICKKGAARIPERGRR